MHPLKSDATFGPTELQLDTRRQSVATQLDVITPLLLMVTMQEIAAVEVLIFAAILCVNM